MIGPNHSFSRFVKYFLKDELIDQEYVILLRLVKKQRGTNQQWLGKLGKQDTPLVNGNKSLLNITLFHLFSMDVGLGNLLDFWFVIPFQGLHFWFGSMLPTPFSVTDVFKRSHSVNICYNTLKPSFYVCCS